MSKGLEALQNLRTFYIVVSKDLMEHYIFASDTKEYQIVEKELKALEIIKYKNISIECLKRAIRKEGLEWYNSLCPYLLERLNKEEYELLKEVLL